MTLSPFLRRSFLTTPAARFALFYGLFCSALAVLYLLAAFSPVDISVTLVVALATFVAAVLLIVLCAAARNYLINRKCLYTGATWSAGENDTALRFDTPVSTIVLRKSDIAATRRQGGLVVITLKNKVRTAVPTPLVDALNACGTPDQP